MSYVEETLASVHKNASPSFGEICLALARRRVSLERVRLWVLVLRRAADDLELLACRMEQKK